jgi:hypothetical protein
LWFCGKLNFPVNGLKPPKSHFKPYGIHTA